MKISTCLTTAGAETFLVKVKVLLEHIEEDLQMKKSTFKQTRLFHWQAKMFPRNGTTGHIEQSSHNKSLADKEVQ